MEDLLEEYSGYLGALKELVSMAVRNGYGFTHHDPLSLLGTSVQQYCSQRSAYPAEPGSWVTLR